MIHLGFFGIIQSTFNRQVPPESIQPMTSDQWFAPVPIRHHARKSLSKFLHPRINRLHASQNAAALLFDLGTVDIR